MSSAAASVWQEVRRTLTVRQYLQAISVALLSAGIGCLIYLVEKKLFRTESRFAENPIELMVRAFGLAHFLIGWLFLFTSPQLRSRHAVCRLAAATLAGIGLCSLFALLGAMRNPFLYLFFYSYFLIHEIRDEAVICRSYGEAPADPREGHRLLNSLSLAAASLLTSVLAAGYAAYLSLTGRISLRGVPAVVLFMVVTILILYSAWTVQRFLRLGQQAHGNLPALLNAYRSLLTVYAGILLILLASAPLGSIGFIVLLHVSAWLVFVRYRLEKQPISPGRNLWKWLRHTPTGFVVLHVTLAVVLLVLMGVRVHVWKRAGLVSELLAGGSFCYWALMHISMSFWSSR